MPVRIKPIHDLGPCTLDLQNIEEVIALLSKEFDDTICSASDGVWELYDEKPNDLFAYVSKRDKLDTLVFESHTWKPYQWVEYERWKMAVQAGMTSEAFQPRTAYIMHYSSLTIPEERQQELEAQAKLPRTVTLTFSATEATFSCVAETDDFAWVQDFLVTLKNRLGQPYLRQRFSSRRTVNTQVFGHDPITLAATWTSAALTSAPYCRIQFKESPPNSLFENIKGNLLSNALWAIGALVIAYALYKFGVKLPEFMR